MSRYLVFQLYAPLQSWGEAAVGEVRHTSSIPSRSALLGLLAAALGIRREAEQQINLFNQHYKFAIRPMSGGEQWLQDYHTLQMPRENKKLNFATRRDELKLAPLFLETLLTTREYRCDAYHHVAVKETPDAPYSVDELAHALSAPVFPLYLGRKCCPPALPLAPKILHGTLADIFLQAEQLQEYQNISFIKTSSRFCYWEDEEESMEQLEVRKRSDQPVSRKRWQFSVRNQYAGHIPEGK